MVSNFYLYFIFIFKRKFLSSFIMHLVPCKLYKEEKKNSRDPLKRNLIYYYVIIVPFLSVILAIVTFLYYSSEIVQNANRNNEQKVGINCAFHEKKKEWFQSLQVYLQVFAQCTKSRPIIVIRIIGQLTPSSINK